MQDKKKKIVRIISRLCIGGTSVHVSLLSYHFNNDNWESILVAGVTSENEGDMIYLPKRYGIEPIIIKSMGREISLWKDFLSEIQLIKLLKKEKPDIVHTHTSKAGTLGRIAAILTGVPQIYHTFHGHTFEGYFSPLKTKIFIKIERFLARFSTKIIAISERQKEDLVRFKIAKPDKITIIPLGFDFSRLLPYDKEQKLRQKLNLGPDTITIALIGRVTAIKNPFLFIYIANEVLKQRKNVHFLIIGDGELTEDCKNLVNKLGIQDFVSFTGFIEDLKLIYGSVDIVCITSINEGTPVSLLEAMACQKIVISTPVGGVPDFVKNKENGFLCNANVKAFTEQIIYCLNNFKNLDYVRKQAANDVLSKYSINRLFNDLEHLYMMSPDKKTHNKEIT
ncbi:MAG: glycosyltransferase family 4 protein [Candidatus Cloacimonadaceae bacterium]|jgi:glycosyltransferase involved in cell wall biosynthesis